MANKTPRKPSATITSIDPNVKFRVEESYKAIRTNLVFSIMKRGCKKIVFSSSFPNEGKTTTAINVAITLAAADNKVLLIDADLRKPKVHHYFSFSNAPGLTNYLGGVIDKNKKADIFSIVHTTDHENLSVICSGSIPPNPAEILASEQMADFFDDIESDYDYIILDTPPINIVSDALPLAKISDGVVIVIRSNSSTYPELDKTIASLEFIGAKILGFVVNFTEHGDKKYRGKYSYRYRYGGKYSRYGRYGGSYGYGSSYGANSYGGYGNYGGY